MRLYTEKSLITALQCTALTALSSILSAVDGPVFPAPVAFTQYIPSQNGFALDYKDHAPGDVLTLSVLPDSGCTITKEVSDPTPLGWKPGFTLLLGPKAAGVHVGKFKGTYGCGTGAGTGAPPQWSGAASVDACKEKRGLPANLSASLDGAESKWIKKAKEWLEKSPLIQKVNVTVTGIIKKTDGTECCEGKTERTDFIEYDGTIKGEIEIIVHGGPPALAVPRVTFPIPGTNYDFEVGGNVNVGVNGGGILVAEPSWTGKYGECNCSKLTGSGSAQPQIKAGAEGKFGYSIVDRTSGVELDSDGVAVAATVTAATGLSIQVTQYFGKNCPTDEIKACIVWPNLLFEFEIKIFGISVGPYNWDATSPLYDALGVEKVLCGP